MPTYATEKDYYQLFRFKIIVDEGSGIALPTGHFKTCEIPQYNMDAQEFRTGTRVFAKKQSSYPTVDDIRFVRGVVLGDSGLWDWVRKCITNNAYKINFTILQYHREAWAKDSINDIVDMENVLGATKPAKVYRVYNALPTRFKPSANLDADSKEIAVEELTVAYEYFDIDESYNVSVG